ncbi:MAG TPA: tRNA pseudouridine(55) synthase TruB [Actinomycetota bacterium]|nr:tRNA pseudouridine(55) synthase TruB [Actinomycetota bacterium]
MPPAEDPVARTPAPGPHVADGLLLIDKPAGITSHDAIDEVRRALGVRKVGHAGTLDPMATGLLVMGVGRATRLLRFLSDLPKEYEGTGELGTETDTLDAMGIVKRSVPVDLTDDQLREAMQQLVGEIWQRPPAFSAVKVGGRRLHRLAREGRAVEGRPRQVMVEAFELLGREGSTFDFRVVCSSGTYVRSLVAEVGQRVGTGAHLSRLVRTRIGPFHVGQATSPAQPGAPLPLERAVAHLPRLDLDEEEATAARHGRPLGPLDSDDPHAAFDPSGRLVGIYRDCGAKACPDVVVPA